ncbi:hypothetical protein D3C84_1075260 [compost metagenome]
MAAGVDHGARKGALAAPLPQRLQLGVAGGIPRLQHAVDGARHQLVVSHQQGGEGAAPLLAVGQGQLQGLLQPPLMAGGRDGTEGVHWAGTAVGGL